FRARVASADAVGGDIEIHLDSPTGTLIGTCVAPPTGDWQTWITETCNITPTSGTHTVYLVFATGGFNLQWFAFLPSVEALSYNSLSAGSMYLETCSEGAQDLCNIFNGNYAVYNNINLASKTHFAARVASAGSGGSIQVRLDSPTGTLIGTCPVSVNGDWQTWSTKTCNLTGASGTHNIYLVFTGGSGALFNVEWFDFN
ncbi:MAG TPA: carbohydrate-binding protein, partial [Candidatus Methylacidiphilales bacterium]